MDVVADVTAVFSDRTLWPNLHNKVSLRQGIVQPALFLQDQMRESSAIQVCILHQLGLWMGVATGYVVRRVEFTHLVVT